MTKVDLKRLETEKKHAFIARAYATVLSCIPEQTVMLRKNMQIRLTHQGYNRYIRFHSYGQDINIQIFGDGNVVVEMSELSHHDHKEQLFDYVTEDEKQVAFLAELKKLLSCLITVFVGADGCGFHTYMSYVGDGSRAAEAYQRMMDDLHRAEKES